MAVFEPLWGGSQALVPTAFSHRDLEQAAWAVCIYLIDKTRDLPTYRFVQAE